MIRPYQPSWRTILFGLYIMAGVLTAGSAGLAFGLFSLADYLRGDAVTGLLGVWSGMTFVVIGAAGLPAGVVAVRALQSHSVFEARRPPAAWLWALLLYPTGLALGYWLYDANQGPPILGTFAQIMAMVGPVLFAAIALQRSGRAISAVRAWVHFLLGLWLLPVVAFFAELVILVLTVVVVVVGLSLTPSGLDLLSQLLGPGGGRFTNLPPSVLADLTSQPWLLGVAFLFLCVLIPMVEELLKSAAIWPALPRSPTRSQAFVGGALGGLGFALVEGLFLTQPDMSWFTTAMIRGGASMMHALGAGLTAWGLAEAVVRGRRWRLPLGYATAVCLHGLWNLSALGFGISQLRTQFNLNTLPSSVQPWITGVAGSLIGLLSVGAFLALPLLARRLAKQSLPPEGWPGEQMQTPPANWPTAPS